MSVVESRLDQLEERIERRLDATEPNPAEEARHLSGVERAVLEALHVAREDGADFGDERGHPVLADLAHWSDLCVRAGAPDAADRAGELAGALIEDLASGWREEALAGLDGADAAECFRRLAEARTIDLGVLMRRNMAPPLAGDVAVLREAFVVALEREAPDNALRRSWSIELRDRVDVVLTSIDDVAPRRARAMLDRLIDDLRWHVEVVEPKGLRGNRLRQRIRRLEAERQERRLQAKLERRFGVRNVARFERGILVLIFLVLGLLAFETWFLPPAAEQTARQHELAFWLTIVDTAACAIFLWEFLVKIYYVRGGRWRWFVRHFFVDLLPSIPFGLVMWHGADAVRYGRAARLGRFGRLFRYVRVLRPFIRLIRAFGFLSRGVDRLARKYGALLNRNIVLYPTREERAGMEAHRESNAVRLRRLQSHVNEHWERLLTGAPRPSREGIAVLRVETLGAVRDAGLLARDHHRATPGARHGRDLSANTVLQSLGELTPQQIEAEAGRDFVTRVARALRLLSALRWLPFIGRYVPRLTKQMSDADAVTAAAHQSANELQRQHDRYFWFADLYGTVTPAQFVDRVGTAMVKGAKRPAVRLLLFGIAYLVVVALLPDETRRDASSFLVKAHDALERIVGTVLKVLGLICLAILGLGWWLCRVAGQATEFFSQSAQAQYLALTESVKSRWLERDAAILERRVFVAERLVQEREIEQRGGTDGDVAAARAELHGAAEFVHAVESWLREAQGATGLHRGFDPVERATLLYRDGLDGALLVGSDTRTTSQLLGNPALRNLRRMSGRVPRRERRELQKLDLERQKSFLRGPYLWFSLICQAVEHGVARLLVDYNRHALPLDQLATASLAERTQYENWLSSNEVDDVETDRVLYVTTDFTCLHFLDDDPDRDREVEVRFGPEVARRLKRDRRHLFRRLFGSYPLHKRPHDERVVNLYRVYQNWLAGGRALLIPFRMIWAAIRFAGRFTVWVARCVDDIRKPRFDVDLEAVEGADFHAADRKILRMRLPVALAALRLRARFDAEYLGPTLPDDDDESGLDGDAAADLRYLGASTAIRRELREERRRAKRDMVRLGRLIEGGLWERIGKLLELPASHFRREHLRAAAVAYLGDLNYARRNLSAAEILATVCEEASAELELPPRWWPLWRRRARFARYWNQHGVAGDRDARRAAWRAIAHNVDGAADALKVWDKHGAAGARQAGEAILAELLRHPERITEQLVTLRIVQTLSLVDVLNYREHVYRVGEYESSGDSQPRPL